MWPIGLKALWLPGRERTEGWVWRFSTRSESGGCQAGDRAVERMIDGISCARARARAPRTVQVPIPQRKRLVPPRAAKRFLLFSPGELATQLQTSASCQQAGRHAPHGQHPRSVGNSLARRRLGAAHLPRDGRTLGGSRDHHAMQACREPTPLEAQAIALLALQLHGKKSAVVRYGARADVKWCNLMRGAAEAESRSSSSTAAVLGAAAAWLVIRWRNTHKPRISGALAIVRVSAQD